ncbi:hypothetical protein [Dictyobacter formicarum]|uniref:Uncharacterized protein n=1 Tax=Dictyobacter formicarum TaxID=2778368 RepID=A0ABQ3VHX4_9CHLR|nr:hypothetical protein [Dictyobacter formicarum]GHO85294.1 hypothetical protein KSZ_33000 [Dictyobacter formicarum]
MPQSQHIIKNLARSSPHSNCFHLSQLYSRGLPLVLLLLAGILLLKAVVISHPKERRKHIKYSCGIFLLALLCLSHQWFWILPGLGLYKLLPTLTKIINAYRPRLTQPDQKQDVSYQEYYSPQARTPTEEGSASLHYQYLSSYYSYDEQPQALYPQVQPPR